MAINIHTQLHHARRSATVNHHIVHRQRVKHAFALAHDFALNQAAVVFLKLAHQHGFEHGLVAFKRDIGDKPQTSLVDANQRHAVGRKLAANAQHRAVTAHHQA
jgi:hypothetical protein